MKIFFLLVIILFTQTLQSQWILQSPPPGGNLYDVEFYNRYTGWAVGDGGRILKTTNSGTNWNLVPNPATNKPLSSIHIVDSNICYVVGWFETIIKTTDAGASWIIIRNGEWGFGSSYDGVFFIDENTGWIGGTGQKILKTTNGGETIITHPLFMGEINEIFFKDVNTGLLTSSGVTTFKSTDGGLNWTLLSLPIGTRIPTFNKISVVDNKYCWLAGSDNRVFKSTDFGDSWDTVARAPVAQLTSSMRFATFINKDTGFLGGEAAYLYKSTNGGLNWVRENTGNYERAMFSMYMYNDSLAWIVGNSGKITHTTNGGQVFVGVSDDVTSSPNEFRLEQNYPNPFNPNTTINYHVPERSYVAIKIFDIAGREKMLAVSEYKSAGDYSVNVDFSSLQLGIYFYLLYSGDRRMETKKMIYVK